MTYLITRHEIKSSLGFINNMTVIETGLAIEIDSYMVNMNIIWFNYSFLFICKSTIKIFAELLKYMDSNVILTTILG